MRPATKDRKILPDDLPRIIELYNQGFTQADIGSQYGVDHTTIGYYLIKTGVVIVTPGKRIRRCFLRKKEVSPIFVLKREPVITLAEKHEQNDGTKCQDKDYQEYLKENRQRERRNLIHNILMNIKHVSATIDYGVNI